MDVYDNLLGDDLRHVWTQQDKVYICVPLKQVMAFNKGGGLAALICGLEFAIVC